MESAKTPWMLLVLSFLCGVAFALATEQFGTGTIDPHADWPPGTRETIESENRVYSVWVNGGERFYYKGNTDTFNEFLMKFSAIEIPLHRVVITTGSYVKSLDKKRGANFNWCLNTLSGISLGCIIEQKGEDSVERYPYVELPFAWQDIRFEEVIFPENVELVIRDDVNNPHGTTLILNAKKWSKARLEWIRFSQPYIAGLRRKENDPSISWMEIRTELIEKYLPDYKLFAVDTRRAGASSVFAIAVEGRVVDLKATEFGSMSGLAGTFRNPAMSQFLKERQIIISDPNTAVEVAALTEELSDAGYYVRSLKNATNMLRLYDPRTLKSLHYKKRNWRMSAARKDDYWQINQQYIGPPASIIMQRQWQLVTDANDMLVEVRH